MGLSRSFDKFTKQALPEGEVTAPESLRAQLGPCAECGQGISTHGYELIVETVDKENPAFEDKRFFSIVLCESCYHKQVETGFWLKAVQELGCLVNIIGVILAIVGFAAGAETLGGVGVALVVLPSLARYPARMAQARRESSFTARHFADAQTAKHIRTPFPLWEYSIGNCVPSALAVLVSPDLPISQVSLSDLQRIVKGELTSWSQIGGPDLSICLCLPVGPWREWTLVKRSLLKGAQPGPHEVVGNPLQIVSKIRQTKGAVGFLSLPLVNAFGEGTRSLELDGQKCTFDNGNYPLWILSKLYPTAEFVQPQSQQIGDKNT
jgi:hypothetical protein